MTTISSLQSVMNGAASTTSATTDAVSENEDRFMKLLVAQMRNQDPLNPLDNAQITSQLAQLSTVSGINKLNTTLEALQASMQASQSFQAAGMIGHGVFVPGSSVALSNSNGILGANLTGAADNVTVTVRDAAGNAVRTLTAGAKAAGIMTLGWDGQTDSGATAADGLYSFEVAATSGGQRVGATTLAFGEVSSVTAGTSGVTLSVQNIGDVGMADVVRIY